MIDLIVSFLIDYGYMGMLMAAFLAGSFFPFSSEAVMVGLMAAGLDGGQLCIYATIGNVLGGMFNYGVGRMGKTEWIEKYLHVKKKDLDKAERFMAGRGAWMGFFGFLPLLGSAITIMLGLMRANLLISFISITIGKALRYALLAFGMGLLTGCTAPHEELRPQVTVSIEPLRYFAEQIGGDRIVVQTLVPKGSSPETFEPTAQQMTRLNESQLFIEVGELGFERTWNKRLRAHAPHLISIEASQGIETVYSEGGEPDPHTWTSPDNALVIAQNICKALNTISSKDSAYFKQNLYQLTLRLQQMDQQTRQRIEQATKRNGGKQPSFIIYHPSLTYYAHRYGLRQLALEENGREPSARTIRNLIDEARAHGANIFFVQKEFSDRNALSVSQETGVRVVEINPLSYEWMKEMNRITNEICKP